LPQRTKGYPQASAVTFLIDSKDGKVKGRSECFVYDHNPPIRIPEEWKKRYNIKDDQFRDATKMVTEGESPAQ
jgi:hypothetical protein